MAKSTQSNTTSTLLELATNPLCKNLNPVKREFRLLWDWGPHLFELFKNFISAHFAYRLSVINCNHGIRLGHCAPNPCRNLGLKFFLTHGGIRDTSEKTQTIKKWVGYELCW